MSNNLIDILIGIVISYTYLSELCIALNSYPASDIILFALSLRRIDTRYLVRIIQFSFMRIEQ